MRGRRLGPLGSRFWGVDVRSLVPVPSLTHHSMEYCSKIYFLVVVSFFWVHCFARNATHSKFTASSGRLSRSRISLKILSALSSVLHHLSALTMGSENRICMTLNRTCASSGWSCFEAGMFQLFCLRVRISLCEIWLPSNESRIWF